MEVIKNNYENTAIEYPIETSCEWCNSELRVDEKDIFEGELGRSFFICPVCRNKSYSDDLPVITITKDNIDFPRHFHHFVDGVDVAPEDIKRYIGEAIDFFRENPTNFCYYTGTGNTVIVVLNYSGDMEYQVIVTKDVYETYIPYDKEDISTQTANGWAWSNKGVRRVKNE